MARRAARGLAVLVLLLAALVAVELPGGRPAKASTTSTAYWLAAADGGVFAFGGAPFYGSMGGRPLNRPIVGMAGTHDSLGYWLVASDGGIFAFGDAPFDGSMGGRPLNRPIVGMAVDPATGGYWLVASDGGIFAFGAPFEGSTGNLVLNKPIVGMAATPDGQGYWLVASDGGIFAFGDAPFDGSMGGVPLRHPIVGMAATPSGQGYWFTDSNGAVSAFGDAGYWGSAPQVLNSPVVSIAPARGTGAISGFFFQSGAYGNDVSNWDCGMALPGHAIGVVEVVGWAFGSVNPCLAQQAAWAGAGLNLYVFLSFGKQASSADGNCATFSPADPGAAPACNFGFDAAQDAFAKAQAAGVDTGVAWWLDVEPANWSGDVTANAAEVQGALDGLRAEGLNNVGIYTAPGTWAGIVGPSYSPAVPVWLAWWTGNPQSNCTNGRSYAASLGASLPTGPIVLTQYTDSISYLGHTFDGD
ncbi:MAG TPA: hypothetical protein VKV36_01360, partial [Acidimicrobiales bacterium]|nr:hypothetical protein [Acidimicrobiales bacterium]